MKQLIVVTVVSAGHANHLHLSQYILPCQQSIFLHDVCSYWRPSNSVKALKATCFQYKSQMKTTPSRMFRSQNICHMFDTVIHADLNRLLNIRPCGSSECIPVNRSATNNGCPGKEAIRWVSDCLSVILGQTDVCTHMYHYVSFRCTWTGWWKDCVCNAC